MSSFSLTMSLFSSAGMSLLSTHIPCIYVFRLSSLSHLFISRMINTSNGYTTLHYFPPPVPMKAFHFLSQYHFFPFIWKSVKYEQHFYVSTGADQRTIWKMYNINIIFWAKYLQPTLWPNKKTQIAPISFTFIENNLFRFIKVWFNNTRNILLYYVKYFVNPSLHPNLLSVEG